MFCSPGSSCVYCFDCVRIVCLGLLIVLVYSHFDARCLLRDFGCGLSFLLYSYCLVVI